MKNKLRVSILDCNSAWKNQKVKSIRSGQYMLLFLKEKMHFEHSGQYQNFGTLSGLELATSM